MCFIKKSFQIFNLFFLLHVINAINFDIRKGVFQTCLKCPIEKPARLWTAVFNNNDKLEIRLCKDQARLDLSVLGANAFPDRIQFTNDNYECKSNGDLCIFNYQDDYPMNFECTAGGIIENVHVTVYTPPSYLRLDVEDNTGRATSSSRIIVSENKLLKLKCTITDTKPKSTVTLRVGDKTIEATHGPLNGENDSVEYRYEVYVTRDQQASEIVCESVMKGVTETIAKSLNFKHRLVDRYVLDVQYPPKCAMPRNYNTGYNQSVIMECSGLEANPRIDSYYLKGPRDATSIKKITNSTNKFLVTPQTVTDIGTYRCYLKNEVGDVECPLNLVLGGYPNPPFNCTISYSAALNKTAARINCRIGFNQGGTRGEFMVYERTHDRQLRFAGSVNIFDRKDSDVDYLTKELEQHEYYEFVVMQANNYGNSSQVEVSIGLRQEATQSMLTDGVLRTLGIIGGVIGCIVVLCVCCCCCANSEMKVESFCPCCCGDESSKADRSSSSYKKYHDGFSAISENDSKNDPKYISTDQGLVYKPMLDYPSTMEKSHNQLLDQTDENIYQLNYTTDSNKFLLYDKVHTNGGTLNRVKKQDDDDLTHSFRNELNTKLLKQRNAIESQLLNEPKDCIELSKIKNIPISAGSIPSSSSPTYESSATSSSNVSNNDLINSAVNHNGTYAKLKPPAIKAKPRLLDTPVSPSTSATDVSSINLTPQHHVNDTYANITTYSRNGTISRMTSRPSAAPPPAPSSVSQTTTFYPYISTNYDYAVVNTNQVNEPIQTLKRNHAVKQSDC